MGFRILISSCDKYSDCWEPFFQCMSQFWPSHRLPVSLVTDSLDYSNERVHVETIKTTSKRGPCTWSQSLDRSLERIHEEYVLYMQDDYFLRSPVNQTNIDSAFSHVLSTGAAYACLVPWGPHGPYALSSNPRFVEVQPGNDYGTSLQAAFWKVSSLRSLLRPWENPWDFEKYSPRRMRRVGMPFLTTNCRDSDSCLNYVRTGVISGRWNVEVVDLFHSIRCEVNFAIRGFHGEAQITDGAHRSSVRKRIARRFFRLLSNFSR